MITAVPAPFAFSLSGTLIDIRKASSAATRTFAYLRRENQAFCASHEEDKVVKVTPELLVI